VFDTLFAAGRQHQGIGFNINADDSHCVALEFTLRLLLLLLQGCTKDLQRALQSKADGASSFSKGSYQAAAQHYAGQAQQLVTLWTYQAGSC
jgi:hypothetical protein